jgi:RNA polymerase sigma-70 factor (ECF subfamily)
MNQLTEEQRKVVFLKFIEGRSNMEIADIMDKTEGAVKSLQHRALSTLKSLIETEVNYGKPVI